MFLKSYVGAVRCQIPLLTPNCTLNQTIDVHVKSSEILLKRQKIDLKSVEKYLEVSKISPIVGLFDENYKARLAGGGGDKKCQSKK